MLFLNQKYGVRQVDHLIDYLAFNQKELYNDCNMQLPTNLAYVYYLDNGEVIVFPNGYHPKAEGLLLENKAMLDKMIENDCLLIENPEKTIFEYERDALFTLPNIAYFKNHLDQKLNINEILDKTTIQKYYAGVLKLRKNKKALPLDYVALCVLFGELVRQEKGGQWVLLKRYGAFNPYFIPSILEGNKVIDKTSDRVMGILQRNLKECSILFLSPMVGIDVQLYTNPSAQVIYLK